MRFFDGGAAKITTTNRVPVELVSCSAKIHQCFTLQSYFIGKVILARHCYIYIRNTDCNAILCRNDRDRLLSDRQRTYTIASSSICGEPLDKVTRTPGIHHLDVVYPSVHPAHHFRLVIRLACGEHQAWRQFRKCSVQNGPGRILFAQLKSFGPSFRHFRMTYILTGCRAIRAFL